MTILVESFLENSNSYIVESKETGKKKYFIEGITVQTDIRNRNNRIYPAAVVRREMERYIREMVNQNRAVGELNHPTDRREIDYERVSHKYISLTENGKNWIGKAQVAVGTPMGNVVAGLMDCGVKMGTSTRGTGSTRLCEGVHVVQNDFNLITAGDIVSDPSAPDAYLTNLMENKEWVYANGVLYEKEYEIKKQVNNLAKTKKLNQENMTRLFNLIMEQVSSKGEL